MSIPKHLTIQIEGLQFESLLADWRWLVNGTFIPVHMTVFGDLFFTGDNGGIHFLDLMGGEFKQVAETQGSFDELCNDREHRRVWFIPHLVMELRTVHGDLLPGKCFSCKIPLSLGGVLEAANFEPADIDVHFSILGQLHRQTHNHSAGTIIGEFRIE